MATFRNRNGKWQVQARQNGHASRARSFLCKADARMWARRVEAELDATVIPFDLRALAQTTIRDLLIRYLEEVTVNKRAEASERNRIDIFLRQPWADRLLPISTLKAVRPATVIRDLGFLRDL